MRPKISMTYCMLMPLSLIFSSLAIHYHFMIDTDIFENWWSQTRKFKKKVKRFISYVVLVHKHFISGLSKNWYTLITSTQQKIWEVKALKCKCKSLFKTRFTWMFISAQLMLSLPKYSPFWISKHKNNLQQYANKIWYKLPSRLSPKFGCDQLKIIYILQRRQLLSIWSHLSHLFNIHLLT